MKEDEKDKRFVLFLYYCEVTAVLRFHFIDKGGFV